MIRVFLSNNELLDLLEKHVVVVFDEQATIENVVLELDQQNQMQKLCLELANMKKPKPMVEVETFNAAFSKEEWLLFKLALEVGVGKIDRPELNRKERSDLWQLYGKFIDLQISEESEI